MAKYDTQILLHSLDTIESELEDINFDLIQKDKEGWRKLLKRLTTLLVNNFDAQVEQAIKKCIQYLLSVGEQNFSQGHLDNVQEIFKLNVSENFPSLVETDVFKLNQQIYRFGINEVGTEAGIKLSFDVSDKEAAHILATHNLFFVGDYYGTQLQSELDRILKPYFTSDKSISEVVADMQAHFGKITDKGIDYFEGLAEHTTNRARELGKVTGYEKAGILSYEIRAVMDDRTSEICQEMNGKIFEVADAVAFRDKILGMDDPNEIKEIAPWRSADEIKGLSASELPSGMELPPYHWRCRTVAIAHFE